MSITLLELKRAAIYSALVGLLTGLVLLSDATLLPSLSDSDSEPAATATAAPVQLPTTFRTGRYTDHLGSLVKVDANRITYYSRDVHGGEFFSIDGQTYYRTPSGVLFRTGDPR